MIQLEQPANGRRWAGRVTSVTHIGEIYSFYCDELEDRNSDQFLPNAEIKLYAEASASTRMPGTSNLNTLSDAYNGTWVGFPGNATGRPFDENGICAISFELAGPLEQKYQRAFSLETGKQASRSEVLTSTATSNFARTTDLHTGASDYDLHDPVFDQVVIVPTSATNKPSAITSRSLAWATEFPDGTAVEVIITQSAIWHKTRTAAGVWETNWTSGKPSATEMPEIPDGGHLAAKELGIWYYGTDEDLTGSGHGEVYFFSRVVQGANDRTWTTEIYTIFDPTDPGNSPLKGHAIKATITSVESWGEWDYTATSAFTGAKALTTTTNITSTDEQMLATAEVDVIPHQKYLVTAYWEATIVGARGSDSPPNLQFRIRQDDGVNVNANGNARATRTYTLANSASQSHTPNSQEVILTLYYEFTTGTGFGTEKFHATFDTGEIDESSRNVMRQAEIRVDPVVN